LNIAKTLCFPSNVDNVLLGDFNIDLMMPDNIEVKLTFAEMGLGPLIDQPTRINNKSATLIDHIYSSNHKLSGFILGTDISDHFTTGLYPDQFKQVGAPTVPSAFIANSGE
jgi:hypothetical protein